MAIRAVAALTKAKAVIGAVSAIPVASRTVYEHTSIDLGRPGIYLMSDVSIRLSGHGMSGVGPSSMELGFFFWVVVEATELDTAADTQISDLTTIAVAIAQAIADSISSGGWAGIGAPTIANVGIVIPHEDYLEPVIQVDFSIQGIF